ncbi:putative 60S ribosomal protein L18-3 [Monocercomonoides exilis]|uniref:putative 60S ribosomal protein L18-3 n=1 Tax=Monocercomonoides exilis TaxID=2049356 RepID=UPI00355A08EC|nr:putative 60S ribosomal protein L18-3 [Monocercomonoides exilis]|eukprot:MONOS_2910.1-p1 / transcript=MONOS_2910.1 / gene=MONOS_2910 / organism=Monocercomonoides_exilis_PA203 / gene_product=60S ribosomal protein L18-3 / transcript_product=60S ribosomal protein L18-3 / location=Mono_scaffold00063:132604-133282(+) / protein_length=182 / sequence_SO=supercontig / SO=protein_coding / is_pseudo=false
MAIDLIAGGRSKVTKKTRTNSKNPYMAMLIKLYTFLARRTRSKFNKLILHRLIKSRTVRAPMTVSKIARLMKRQKRKTAVVVATVTDDIRLLDLPRLRIAALRFTQTARARIIRAGGICMTIDQLAMKYPTGKNTVLLRGPLKARKSYRYFGQAAGLPHSHTRPRTLSKISERQRGFKGSK